MKGLIRSLLAVVIVTTAIVTVDLDDLIPVVAQHKPIVYADFNDSTKKEITCLADNIYYEARGETHIGKKAVAYTTLNRLEDGRWEDTICGVVKQRTGTVCQFSWVCDASIDLRKKDERLYKVCRDIAVSVYIDYAPSNDVTNGSVFYHANFVSPNWKNVTYVKTIGNHLFYRTRT